MRSRSPTPTAAAGSLPGAFTVGAGIGQWNPGDLFGGQMQQLLMKPGDPNTLYATAYGVSGLFRSTDAGEHWAFVTDKVSANANGFAVDPLHPDWLYVIDNGLMRSTDEGDTWTTLDAVHLAGRACPSGVPAGARLAVSGRDPPTGSLRQLMREVRHSGARPAPRG